jgi:magnesium chelatase subunit H
MNVVIVTMDSHLAMAERATQLARSLPGLRLTVHAAAEWGDQPQALARCKADIASAHIVIASMFLEDHFLPVLAEAAESTATPWSARCRPPRSPAHPAWAAST